MAMGGAGCVKGVEVADVAGGVGESLLRLRWMRDGVQWIEEGEGLEGAWMRELSGGPWRQRFVG